MSHFDCIVVGAGIEGSATAYSLAQRGQRTLLLEQVLLTLWLYYTYKHSFIQFPLPHSRGSSHGASRITRKAYPASVPVYTEMMDEAYQLWQLLQHTTDKTLFM